MNREVYRYTFNAGVPMNAVRETLDLAIVAAEALHGAVSMRLDARCLLLDNKRVCLIDETATPGSDLNRVFAGYTTREFGDGAFTVQRVFPAPMPAPVLAAN